MCSPRRGVSSGSITTNESITKLDHDLYEQHTSHIIQAQMCNRVSAALANVARVEICKRRTEQCTDQFSKSVWIRGFLSIFHVVLCVSRQWLVKEACDAIAMKRPVCDKFAPFTFICIPLTKTCAHRKTANYTKAIMNNFTLKRQQLQVWHRNRSALTGLHGDVFGNYLV